MKKQYVTFKDNIHDIPNCIFYGIFQYSERYNDGTMEAGAEAIISLPDGAFIHTDIQYITLQKEFIEVTEC